jgi:predicted dehydrogenase
VGLIGLGSDWETRHRPTLRTLANRFEVRAVYDQVAHRAACAADEFRATAVDGFRALLQREDIDAVLVLCRQWHGMLPLLAACDAGRAIYCAAPWDLNLEEATHLRDRIDKSGVAFMAEFERRFAPATLRLKELIATTLGKPRMLFCHLRRPVAADRLPCALGQQNLDVGSRELVQLVDWCLFVVGSTPGAVQGVAHRVHPEGSEFDYEMMSLDFSADGTPGSGAIAQISCGRYVSQIWPEALSFRPPAALQVLCERGLAFIDLPASLTWFDDAGRHLESLESERPASEQMLTQFHREVTSLVRNPRGLEDVYRAVSVVALARRSQQEGRRIPLVP